MPPRPATLTQKELTGYAKAMQEAYVPVWAIEVDEPDGTRIRIMAGATQAQARGADINKILGITNG